MTAQVPVCHLAGAGSATNKNAVAGIALRSNLFSEVAHIDLRCGGGHGSVMSFIAAEAEGPPHPAIAKRRRILRVSIFRNMAACRDEFTATNTRTDNTKMVMVRIPCQVVQCHAQPDATLADIWGTWSPPAANVRLWEFRNVAITSYNGTHGIICGPWPSGKHLEAPVITVRMIPSDPSNSCRNFGVLLKGTS